MRDYLDINNLGCSQQGGESGNKTFVLLGGMWSAHT